MTDHTPFQNDLKAYADGELSLPRRLAVRLHLTRCASCREEITQMTQIAEDLRESEPDAVLDPAFRKKLLAIAPPTPNSGGAGDVGAPLAAPAPPTPPELRGRGRKQPALAWILSGAALAAWFVFFPLLHKGREGGYRSTVSMASPSGSLGQGTNREGGNNTPSMPDSKVTKPQRPPQLQVRLSNREAGVDIDGAVQTYDKKVYVQVKNPNSNYRDRSGNGTPVYAAPIAANSLAGAVGYPGGGGAGAVSAPPDVPQRQVHKEATIGLQVPNPEAASDTVETMVKETGGFVAGNTLDTGDDGLKSAELTVKVPVTQFETFLRQVAKLGSVQSKNLSGEDITEKTSDADQTEGVLEDDVQKSEARIKALGSKAKWRDEQATRDLRIELAQARARLVLLKRMAALSTVTIDLSQTPKPSAPAPVTGGFLNGLKGSTHDALQSLVGSASALLALVIWLLAYAPLWIPLLLGGRYALREYRRRQVM